MDIKVLLTGYQNRMLDKIEKQANEKMESIIEADELKKIFKKLNVLMVEQLKNINESFSQTEEGLVFSDEELERISEKINIPYSYRLTNKTKNLLEETKETVKKQKENLSTILNEVYLLASYLEKPEEVTNLLKTYRILDSNGKFNMDLV